MLDTVIAYLIVAVFAATVMFFVLSGIIVDWLSEREKRKKAAAKAESAAKPA